jgi:lysine-specific demethylase 8
MSHWPALDRWQHPEYLLAVAGQRTVPIELGKHYLEEGWSQSLVSLGEFMARHIMPAGANSLRLDLRSMLSTWLSNIAMYLWHV